MAGQREMLDLFMKNTGVDHGEAMDILSRNRWNLENSYRETERLHMSGNQRNHTYVRDGGGGLKNLGSHHQAIDMGLGAAVHLDKASAGLPQRTQTNPVNPFQSTPQNMTSTFPSQRQYGQNMCTLPAGLSVKLPPSSVVSNQQERIIPIQMEGGRTVVPSQPFPGFKLISDGSSGDAVPHSNTSPTSVPDTGHQNMLRGNLQQSRPRFGLDEQVHPSHPPSAAPVRVNEIPPDYQQEEEDVFDDKHFKQPPPVSTYPRLKRGFSNILENEGIVSEARHSVKADIMKDSHDNMYIKTFVLPDLTAYSDDFRAFLGKELIETSTLVSLEQAGRLNWWAELRLCQRLLPMATSGDGNCLLHAASLAMWGIHDRQLILRKELHETLTKASYKDALYRRWRYQQTMSNKQSGLVFSEAEWKDEWDNILRLASPVPRGAPDPARSNNCCDSAVTQGCEEPVVYESLEEFHVFVLAHVLQRPIIVVADAILKDSSGEALAPIPFPGIYLPLEVHPCYKSPLLLTYDAAHFSALCPMEQPTTVPHLPAAIPLVDPELKLLPLHFHIDPGTRVDWSKDLVLEPSLEDKINLLQKFLEVERLPLKLADVNGDSDRGSCGSQDSDETGVLVREKDKKKEDKKKDARMSQQVQTVAKQFGSIGKSMGKKLKQLGKVGKGDKSRRPSVGNEITQSTRVISNYGGQGNGQDYVLVAKLSEKRGKQQQEMIRNYLQDASVRFQSDKELKRQSDVELRSKVVPHPAVNVTTACVTSGCSLFGTAQTNNMCSKCFAAHQRESTMVQKSAGGGFVYNTFPGRGKPQSTPPMLADEIFVYGKSKFYTSSNENVGPPTSDSLNVSNLDKQVSRSNNSIVSAPRIRSPSPDYDNLIDFPPQRDTRAQSNPKPVASQYMEDRQQCRAPGCEFYGSRESDGLCSKCYQKKYQETLARAVKSTTKL